MDTLRLIAPVIPDAVIAADSAGTMLYVNPATERMFGYAADELIGRNVRMLSPEPLRSAHDGFVQHYLGTGEAHVIGGGREVEALRRDGSRFPVRLALGDMGEDNPDMWRFLALIQDLTEERRAQRELNEQHALLRLVLDRVPALVAYVDTNERYRLASSAYTIFTTLPPETLCGLSSREVLGEERYAVIEPYFRKALNGEEQAYEADLPEPDGSTRRFEIRYTPDYGDDGKVQGVLILALDVTTQRLMEIQASERLTALAGLVAGVAHEVNNPIGIAHTSASHLQETTRRVRDEWAAGKLTRSELDTFFREATEASGLVISNLQRSARLVREFKQVAADQRAAAPRRFELCAYLQEVLNTLGPLVKHRPIQIIFECATRVELNDHADAWAQIVINLVQNSLTHGYAEEQSGRIELRVSREPDAVILDYRDDGLGMPESVRLHALEPFFTTRRGQGGSGLGLSIVHNLVTALFGGTLQVQSHPGMGVRFTIRRPLTPETSTS